MKFLLFLLTLPFKVFAVLLWNAFGIAVSVIEVTYDIWVQFLAELRAEWRELREPVVRLTEADKDPEEFDEVGRQPGRHQIEQAGRRAMVKTFGRMPEARRCPACQSPNGYTETPEGHGYCRHCAYGKFPPPEGPAIL